jgi:UPF0755 protein
MKILAAIVLILLAGAGAAGYVMHGRLETPFRGYQGDAALVTIPSGASTRAIGDRLVEAGVVQDTVVYRVALWLSGDARRLQAGEYRFDRPMPVADVIGKIARGEVDLVPITFPEGRTIREMAAIYEGRGLGTAAAFIAATKDPSLVHTIDPDARDLEGYTFPDTYAVSRSTDAAQLVAQMVERFTKVMTPALREAAVARGLTVRQLVTLASIVEKETGRADERPLVAAVYANRLRIGMALQCDPTLIYGLQRVGRYDGNIHKDDLQFDSPYNTYKYPGLPPGPIAAPGRASLEAAAHPADADFLYFVSRNDGSHEFARTLDEHNRNVQRYQIEFFRARRNAGTRH